MKNQLRYVIKSMRPKQWPKNAFLFAALVFDRQLFTLESFLITFSAFILFCLVSSLVYIINDLVDIEKDQQHPVKRERPLASGKLSKKTAITAAVILSLIVFPAAFILDLGLGLILIGYLILMLAYSFYLKNLPLIDVMVIAAGFVLRVAAGLVIIETERFSPWLFVTTTFLALFIALGKRRTEIHLLESGAEAHRHVLSGYTLDLLDQLLTVVLSITLMTYCLYTFSAEILPGNHSMMLTIPFVIFGLFRYLYLVRIKNIGGAPEEVVFTDRPMQAAVGLWALTVIAILYLF